MTHGSGGLLCNHRGQPDGGARGDGLAVTTHNSPWTSRPSAGSTVPSGLGTLLPPDFPEPSRPETSPPSHLFIHPFHFPARHSDLVQDCLCPVKAPCKGPVLLQEGFQSAAWLFWGWVITDEFSNKETIPKLWCWLSAISLNVRLVLGFSFVWVFFGPNLTKSKYFRLFLQMGWG